MEGEEESSLDVTGDDIDLGYEERPVNRYGSPIALPESADYEEAGPSRAPPSRVVSSSCCSKDISNHCSQWSFSGVTTKSRKTYTS